MLWSKRDNRLSRSSTSSPSSACQKVSSLTTSASRDQPSAHTGSASQEKEYNKPVCVSVILHACHFSCITQSTSNVSRTFSPNALTPLDLLYHSPTSSHPSRLPPRLPQPSAPLLETVHRTSRPKPTTRFTAISQRILRRSASDRSISFSLL